MTRRGGSRSKRSKSIYIKLLHHTHLHIGARDKAGGVKGEEENLDNIFSTVNHNKTIFIR
jgi:hypothetical protein